MIGGTACFVVMAALVKAASSEAHVLQAALFRSAVSVPPVWVAMRIAHIPVRSVRWPLLVGRGVVGFTALCFYLWAVTHTELANAVALQQLSPLFVAILSMVWLRERPRWTHHVLALVCLGGALMVVRPTRGIASLGAAAALASAFFAAAAYVSVRALTRTEPVARIVLWFSAVATVLALPLAALVWRPLSSRAIGLLVGAGVVAIFGQGLMTSAYRRAQAHVAAAFSYASVPFGFLIGAIAWGESPDGWASAGIALIVVGGVGIAWSVRHDRLPVTAPGSQRPRRQEGVAHGDDLDDGEGHQAHRQKDGEPEA